MKNDYEIMWFMARLRFNQGKAPCLDVITLLHKEAVPVRF